MNGSLIKLVSPERDVRRIAKAQREASWEHYRQSEFYSQLLRLLDLDAPIPSTRSWAASPDVLLSLLHHAKQSNPKTILDAGCGLGYTTTVIAELLPEAHVLGIDLAEDAIAYATSTHKNASFGVVALDPSAERIGSFDLIFCFEIYPFSRNRDVAYQSQLIKNLSENLSSSGKIIISQTWRNKDALPPVLGEVTEMCPDLLFQVVSYPHPRIPLWLPRKLALYAAKVVEKLTGKEVVKKLIVISKRA